MILQAVIDIGSGAVVLPEEGRGGMGRNPGALWIGSVTVLSKGGLQGIRRRVCAL